jgi:propanol-preferring alcohol dehydrogenase
MRAMVLHEPGDATRAPLREEQVADPANAADEIVVGVSTCGVCRTDLHVVEAEVPPEKLPLIPGHQVVGRVLRAGDDVSRFQVGDRVGVAWVHRFCGTCGPCIAGRENLCEEPTFTGLHVDGGYAEQVCVPAAFAHPIPHALGDDVRVAPLLCGGIIGYRALKQSGLTPGASLALFGFGASAHIALQIARAWGCEVFVVSRNRESLDRARDFGASWTGVYGEPLPRRVGHAVTFAPAGHVIASGMEALRPGGRLATAGIYVDNIPELDYERHLFYERSIVSVTANTRQDATELLTIAGQVGIRTDVKVFDLGDANDALARLKSNRLGAQAGVLRIA